MKKIWIWDLSQRVLGIRSKKGSHVLETRSILNHNRHTVRKRVPEIVMAATTLTGMITYHPDQKVAKLIMTMNMKKEITITGQRGRHANMTDPVAGGENAAEVQWKVLRCHHCHHPVALLLGHQRDPRDLRTMSGHPGNRQDQRRNTSVHQWTALPEAILDPLSSLPFQEERNKRQREEGSNQLTFDKIINRNSVDTFTNILTIV